jgi:hypothetical protein
MENTKLSKTINIKYEQCVLINTIKREILSKNPSLTKVTDAQAISEALFFYINKKRIKNEHDAQEPEEAKHE